MVRDLAVESGGQLEGDEGALGPGELVQECRVLARGLLGAEPDFDLDALGDQSCRATARFGIGIGDGGDDFAHAGLDECPSTGRLLSLVIAGFQGDEDGASRRPRARRLQCRNLGVPLAELGVKPFPD